MKTRLLAFSLVWIVIVLSGCATIPKEADLKASPGERAGVYWKLRMEDKYEETYKMESKEGRLPFSDYLKKAEAIKKFAIVSHSIKETKLEGQKAIVDVEVSFVMPGLTKPFTQHVPDEWIKEDGIWRHKF